MTRMETVNVVLNWVVIVGAVVFLFRPEGPATTAVRDYWARHRLQERIEERWDEIRDLERRVDDGSAPVRLVEFADYQCPFCRRTHHVLDRFLDDHDQVGIVFRHFPLDDIHPHARDAALASVCTERQGRFREMHARLFGISSWDTAPEWRRIADEAGVEDLDRFRDCLTSREAKTRLRRDIELGRELGVEGTPTFVHGEGLRAGVVDARQLEEMIPSEGGPGAGG